MTYVTVWTTRKQNQVLLARNILEQNDIKYRILNQMRSDNFPVGTRIQVPQEQRDNAVAVLREQGVYKDRRSLLRRFAPGRFWIYFIFALVLIIVASIFINRYFL